MVGYRCEKNIWRTAAILYCMVRSHVLATASFLLHPLTPVKAYGVKLVIASLDHNTAHFGQCDASKLGLVDLLIFFLCHLMQ